MTEERAMREVVSAVLDGESVDWDRARRDARVNAAAPALKSLASAPRATPVLPWAPRRGTALAILAIFVVAAIQIAVALVGYLMGFDVETPVPAVAAALSVAAFATAAVWLFAGGRHDTRARALAVVFLLIASSFARRFTGFVGGAGVFLIRGVYLDAFLPVFVWVFARDFPRVVRLSRWDDVTRHGTRLAAMTSASLFLINLVRTYAPSFVPPILSRSHPRSAYWAAVVGLSVVALSVSLLRARRAQGDERRRARLFAWALAVPLLPIAAEISLEIASADFKRLMSQPDVRRTVAPGIFALLLSVPFLTAYTVIVERALDVRVVIAKTLQYLFARVTLTTVAVGPLCMLAWYGYQHRALTIDALFTGRRGLLLGAASLCGFVGLMTYRRVLRAVERYLLGAQIDVGDVVTTLPGTLRGAQTWAELAQRVDDHLQGGLGVTTARVLRRDADRGLLAPLREPARGLPLDTALVSMLAAGDAPLAVGRQQPATYYALLPRREREWVDGDGVAVVAPLLDQHSELVGVLAVGQKRNGAPILPAELLYVAGTASALAMATGSLRSTGVTGEPGGTEPAAECQRCGLVGDLAASRCACGGVRVAAPVPVVVAHKFRVERRLGAGAWGSPTSASISTWTVPSH